MLLRKEIWTIEPEAGEIEVGPGLHHVPDPSVVVQVRAKKRELKKLVDQRLQEAGDNTSVPADRVSWWREWERHYWVPDHAFVTTPWDYFPSGYSNQDDVPAETPP